MDTQVQHGHFQGPLDVLLKLVTTSEVDIYEIALCDIINAFCDQIEQLGRTSSADPQTPARPADQPDHQPHQPDHQPHQPDQVQLDQITQFLVPAAILVELKSRRLLPVHTSEADIESELELYGQRDLALARLIEGHTFVAAAQRLRELTRQAAQHYARRSGPDERFLLAAPDPLKGVTPADIANALRSALSHQPEPILDVTHIAAPPKTVEQCAYELVKRLPGSGSVSFRELTEHIEERVIVVAHFLALLELYKLGYVELSQIERFGDIEILWVAGTADVDLTELDVAANATTNRAGVVAAADEFAA